MTQPTRLLIRHARILLPQGDFMQGDVYVVGRAIAQIGADLSALADATDASTTVIDATGLTLLPGVIDPQVHFREPGLEHKEDLFTASWAAGGLRPRPAQYCRARCCADFWGLTLRLPL